MKRRIPCSIAACLIVVLITVGTVTIGEEYCFKPDSSGFVTLDLSGFNGSVNITTDSSAYQDFFELLSTGAFSIYHKASVCSLERSVALSNGRACAVTHLPNNMIQVEFEGSGSFSTSFDTDGRTFPNEYLYVWLNIDADQFSLSVPQGRMIYPPPRPCPQLRLMSVGGRSLSLNVAGGGGTYRPGIPVEQSIQAAYRNTPTPTLQKASTTFNSPHGTASQRGTEIFLTVTNPGNAPLAGEATVELGLSYARDWVAEGSTVFFGGSFGWGTIFPGRPLTFRFVVPDVPLGAVATLQVLKLLWTGYNDPEPDQDYVCITMHIGTEKIVAFVPLVQ